MSSKTNNNNIALLVNSCDKYETLWPIYFGMLKRFWQDCNCPIYLNTESKKYSFDGLEINVLNSSSEKLPWSKRLREVLLKIDSELILLTLDDFILEEPVDTAMLNTCIDTITNHHEIGVIQLVVGSENGQIEYPHLREQQKKQAYRINCQMAIWRKEYLLKILRDFETPWEFEKFGSIRSRRYKEKVYAWSSEENYVFTYNWGKPIIGGKWNLDEVDRLEEKLGIKFDLEGREGMRNYYENLKLKPFPKRNLKWVLKKISHIKSLI